MAGWKERERERYRRLDYFIREEIRRLGYTPKYLFTTEKFISKYPESGEILVCIKCGSNTSRIRYQPREVYGYMYQYIIPEHMNRICNTCEYTWKEQLPDRKEELK